MSGAYKPTMGMLRALSDAPGASALDHIRCRLRGLTDTRDMPTPMGRIVINREINRRAASGSGPQARPSGQQRSELRRG